MAAAETENFFEGTEKLLEVWFGSSRNVDNKSDLTTISRNQWENLLKYVQCEIISETRRDNVVSYVLSQEKKNVTTTTPATTTTTTSSGGGASSTSPPPEKKGRLQEYFKAKKSESSMFISENRFILKTCGNTTLLHAIKPLLKLVYEETGLDTVEDFFYSRMKFQRPELQHKVHQNFEDEAALLDELFENGAAYALGRLNRDCWYLYTFDTIGVLEPDQTLELLMQDLNRDIMHIFTQEGSANAAEASKKSGITDLIPGTVIDDVLFEPCGYSMNGLLPNNQYFTIHITPEPECSYVSFESNVPQASYRKLINKVLKIFKPGRFLMTVFANKASVARDTHLELAELEYLDGYNRTDHQLCQFKNYNLTYTHYTARGRARIASINTLPLPPAAPPH